MRLKNTARHNQYLILSNIELLHDNKCNNKIYGSSEASDINFNINRSRRLSLILICCQRGVAELKTFCYCANWSVITILLTELRVYTFNHSRLRHTIVGFYPTPSRTVFLIFGINAWQSEARHTSIWRVASMIIKNQNLNVSC